LDAAIQRALSPWFVLERFLTGKHYRPSATGAQDAISPFGPRWGGIFRPLEQKTVSVVSLLSLVSSPGRAQEGQKGEETTKTPVYPAAVAALRFADGDIFTSPA
jgi:hypothetical protein